MSLGAQNVLSSGTGKMPETLTADPLAVGAAATPTATTGTTTTTTPSAIKTEEIFLLSKKYFFKLNFLLLSIRVSSNQC